MGEEDFDNSYRRTARGQRDESSTSEKGKTPFTLWQGLALLIVLFFFFSCGSSRKVVIRESVSIPPVKEVVATPTEVKKVKTPTKTLTNKEKITQYIEKFSSTAQEEMNLYGIPASITLAQGILESGLGYGRLAIEGNNHFGIKCHSDWSGKRIYHDDDEKGECFRVYKNPATSYRDHSLFLTERGRYAFLFEIKIDNYKAWAKGLKKAGYATDPKYPEKLISLIERFDLARFDSKKGKTTKVKKEKKEKNQTTYHTVQKGDTLYSISKKYNVSLGHIIKHNKIKDKTIYLGQNLSIPINP